MALKIISFHQVFLLVLLPLLDKLYSGTIQITDYIVLYCIIIIIIIMHAS